MPNASTWPAIPRRWRRAGGTSESSPLTAGVAALVIQAYEKTHSGALPSPALVKQILTSTADDIQAPADQQGSGLLDAYRAVLAAEAYQAPPATAAPDTLLESTPQFNATGGGGNGRELHRATDQPGVDAGDGGRLQPDARRLHARSRRPR